MWSALWFLLLLVLVVGLLAALCAILFQRQRARSGPYAQRMKRTQYHGIPTEDLDNEQRFSFQDEGINLIDGRRIDEHDVSERSGGGGRTRRSPSLSSSDDVLIDTQFGGSSSESDINLSNDDVEHGNIADVDDFRVDKADVEFDFELSDDDETGFAGW